MTPFSVTDIRCAARTYGYLARLYYMSPASERVWRTEEECDFEREWEEAAHAEYCRCVALVDRLGDLWDRRVILPIQVGGLQGESLETVCGVELMPRLVVVRYRGKTTPDVRRDERAEKTPLWERKGAPVFGYLKTGLTARSTGELVVKPAVKISVTV